MLSDCFAALLLEEFKKRKSYHIFLTPNVIPQKIVLSTNMSKSAEKKCDNNMPQTMK